MINQLVKVWRIFWRLLFLAIHIIIGLILTVPFLHQSIPPDSFAASLTRWWYRLLCKIFGVKLTCKGIASNKPTLFVANHISWFDIPALGSCIAAHFLSKDEVKHWPIIGWMAGKAGTLYISRGQRGAAEQSIDDITQTLNNGLHVVIFPEGTTTDGNSVKRFHSRLFQAAINAGADIQPVVIAYPHVEGIHPKAAFIGETDFLESTLDIMAEAQMDANVEFLTPISSTNASRDELARICQQSIENVVKQTHQIN